MSLETLLDLNRRQLIGFTDKRGKGWAYREELQGDEPNIYAGAIPIEEVRRRLFNWKAVEGTFAATIEVHPIDEETGEPDETQLVEHVIPDPSRKVICRPPGAFGPEDPGANFGVFRQGYEMHHPDEWLLENVGHILGEGLAIGSAGFFRQGAQAYVQVEMPESIETAGGSVRPFLLATTSFDGSWATGYNTSYTRVECDNTCAWARSEGAKSGEVFKVKHTKNSGMRILEAKEALGIVHAMGEDIVATIERQTNVPFSSDNLASFFDIVAPLVDGDGNELSKTGTTRNENVRSELSRMWNHDARVAPIAGTEYGALQLWNTYVHHESKTKGVKTLADRAARNGEWMASGKFDAVDSFAQNAIDRILGRELVLS